MCGWGGGVMALFLVVHVFESSSPSSNEKALSKLDPPGSAHVAFGGVPD